eukprot:m.67017 g.67017  ORF g.67017 m.67017 type:complete len:338 (+) comp11563_c0_seq1:121-1134(+)
MNKGPNSAGCVDDVSGVQSEGSGPSRRPSTVDGDPSVDGCDGKQNVSKLKQDVQLSRPFQTPQEIAEAFGTVLPKFSSLDENFHRGFHSLLSRVPFPPRSFEAMEPPTISSSFQPSPSIADPKIDVDDDDGYICQHCQLIIPYPKYCMGCTLERYPDKEFTLKEWDYDISEKNPTFRYKHELLARLKHLDSFGQDVSERITPQQKIDTETEMESILDGQPLSTLLKHIQLYQAQITKRLLPLQKNREISAKVKAALIKYNDSASKFNASISLLRETSTGIDEKETQSLKDQDEDCSSKRRKSQRNRTPSLQCVESVLSSSSSSFSQKSKKPKLTTKQ